MDFIKSGQFISELRKAKCMTQADLGAILGVTDKTVSKWERGVNIPDVLMIREIAKVFNVTADEILNAQKDITDVSTILKFYRNKKLIYSLIGMFSLLVISFFVLLIYFTNNYDKSKIYKFKGAGENYNITGYIYGVGNQVRVVLDDFELNDVNEFRELNIKKYGIKFYLNGNLVSSNNVDFEEDYYIDFLKLIDDFEKTSFDIQNINFDLLISNGSFLIEFFDTKNNSYSFKFDFISSIDLRNNRFFYN